MEFPRKLNRAVGAERALQVNESRPRSVCSGPTHSPARLHLQGICRRLRRRAWTSPSRVRRPQDRAGVCRHAPGPAKPFLWAAAFCCSCKGISSKIGSRRTASHPPLPPGLRVIKLEQNMYVSSGLAKYFRSPAVGAADGKRRHAAGWRRSRWNATTLRGSCVSPPAHTGAGQANKFRENAMRGLSTSTLWRSLFVAALLGLGWAAPVSAADVAPLRHWRVTPGLCRGPPALRGFCPRARPCAGHPRLQFGERQRRGWPGQARPPGYQSISSASGRDNRACRY